MHDAGVGRHHREVAQRRLAPAQEGVALAVARELELAFSAKASACPASSTCTEWSMTSSAGCSGLMLRRIAAHALHGVAHGGQIDDRRHAGEVLQQHARRRERDLVDGRGLRIPVRRAPGCPPPCTVRPSSRRSRFSSRILQRVRQPRRIDAAPSSADSR